MLNKFIFWLSAGSIAIPMIHRYHRSSRNDLLPQPHLQPASSETHRRLACKWVFWKHETVCGDAGGKPNTKAVPKPAAKKGVPKDKKAPSQPPSRGCANNSAVYKEGNQLAKIVGERVSRESRLDKTIIRLQAKAQNHRLLGAKENVKNELSASANISSKEVASPSFRHLSNVTTAPMLASTFLPVETEGAKETIADQNTVSPKGGRITSKECDGEIAFVMGGQMRAYHSVYAALKSNILDALKPDTFISTWKEVGETYRFTKGAVSKSKLVDPKDLQNLYSPCEAEIEAFPKDGNKVLRGIRSPGAFSQGTTEQRVAFSSSLPNFYKIYMANELKKLNEDRRGFQYRYVIRMRPDMLVTQPLPLDSFGKDLPGGLWMSDYKIRESTQASDKLAIGNSNIMDYYASLFARLPYYWRDASHGLGDKCKKHAMLNGERLMWHHLHVSPYSSKAFNLHASTQRHGN